MATELHPSSDDDQDPEQFFLCEVRLDGRDYFLVWRTAESNSLWRDQHGHLLVDAHEQRLRESAESQGIRIEPDAPAQYDFDKTERWCAKADDTSVDCNAILNHWNFLDDLAAWPPQQQSAYQTASKNATGVYNKLFFGCNLPAVTPAGEEYLPNWSADELVELREVLIAGIELLKTELKRATNK